MTNVTIYEAKEVIQKGAMKKLPVYVIAPSPKNATAFAMAVGLKDQQYQWVSGPQDLEGTKHPLVVILPNWWRHDYSGMEGILNKVEADVRTVHYGHKPNYKNDNSNKLPRH